MIYTNYSSQRQLFKTKSTGSRKWLKRINDIMETALYDPDLTNIKMAEELEISERDLFRKVRLTTGLSPQKYFRQYRLQKAMEFLKNGKFKTVRDTGKAIGYSNTSYFILQFEKTFGKKPLQVLKEQGWR